ncbi:MAG: CBS domain-containing protein [Candidatus Bathyarchaeota archaeon]|nr:CBS domain-containing protein [Candidatus Bathyarchaeota archaeon]
MSLRVEDVMITDVITIKADYPVKYADSLMKYFGIDCLVVMEDNQPIGIITDNDIVRKVYTNNDDPHLVFVKEVMTEPILWVTPETPLNEAVETMVGKNIKRLPVIGNLSNGPVLLGLISRKVTERSIEEIVFSK